MSQDQQQPQARFESRFDKALYHLDQAMKHMAGFMDELSKENFEMQKGYDFIKYRRDLLLNAIDKAGGQVSPGSIEAEMKEFIPLKYRRPTNGDNTPANDD